MLGTFAQHPTHQRPITPPKTLESEHVRSVDAVEHASDAYRLVASPLPQNAARSFQMILQRSPRVRNLVSAQE
ncbi:hypothetical protein G6F68_012434 [Rhizopus microsporus]|nr:hypothetical protein G6F68_012434 [Rhizopus microsporus]